MSKKHYIKHYIYDKTNLDHSILKGIKNFLKLVF